MSDTEQLHSLGEFLRHILVNVMQEESLDNVTNYITEIFFLILVDIWWLLLAFSAGLKSIGWFPSANTALESLQKITESMKT